MFIVLTHKVAYNARMAIRGERVECGTSNVLLVIPRAWYPDENTIRAMAYVSQHVLGTLHMAIGRARITFVEDAKYGTDQLVIRTPDKLFRHDAQILVHPRMRNLVVSDRSDDNVIGIVASAAALTRYSIFSPWASEEKKAVMQRRAHSLAVQFIENARTRHEANA